MSILLALLHNRVFLSAVFGWLFAQIIKLILEIAKGGFTMERLVRGGGMPSSHSATVTALAASAGITQGFDSAVFAVALFLAFIVMFDAMNVRRAAGEDGKALNQWNERLQKEGKEPLLEKPLPEKLGHTFPEVAAGIGVGILAALVVCVWMP